MTGRLTMKRPRRNRPQREQRLREAVVGDWQLVDEYRQRCRYRRRFGRCWVDWYPSTGAVLIRGWASAFYVDDLDPRRAIEAFLRGADPVDEDVLDYGDVW